MTPVLNIYHRALNFMGVSEWITTAAPSNTDEFIANFRKVVGTDNQGSAIFSSSQEDWGFTIDDLNQAILAVQTEYDAQAYARSRVQEYPPIGDQLDALFKAGVFPADMAAAIQAVKDKYPKGTA